jgi:hypothetical protein
MNIRSLISGTLGRIPVVGPLIDKVTGGGGRSSGIGNQINPFGQDGFSAFRNGPLDLLGGGGGLGGLGGLENILGGNLFGRAGGFPRSRISGSGGSGDGSAKAEVEKLFKDAQQGSNFGPKDLQRLKDKLKEKGGEVEALGNDLVKGLEQKISSESTSGSGDQSSSVNTDGISMDKANDFAEEFLKSISGSDNRYDNYNADYNNGDYRNGREYYNNDRDAQRLQDMLSRGMNGTNIIRG